MCTHYVLYCTVLVEQSGGEVVGVFSSQVFRTQIARARGVAGVRAGYRV